MIRNPIGCSMAIRRRVFDEVGLFAEDLGRVDTLPVGCEETELCIRASDLHPGGRFVLEPRAVVHHKVPGGRTRWRYFRDRCRAEGVSKAWVTRRVGSGSGLSSERSHAMRALPLGVLRALGSIRLNDLSGLARAAAIVVPGGGCLLAPLDQRGGDPPLSGARHRRRREAGYTEPPGHRCPTTRQWP